MVKQLLTWIKNYFEQTRIQAMEIHPVYLEKGKVQRCAVGMENAYAVYQRDAGGLFLKEHFEDLQAARKLAFAEGQRYGVEVLDSFAEADMQRARERFKIGEKPHSYLSDAS